MTYGKRGVLALLTLMAAALLAGDVRAQQGPGQGAIVFIDSQQILAAAPGAREAQQTLEQEVGTLRQQVQQMETTLDSLMAVYDQRQVMLSPEAKRQMEEEIRAKQREFQGRAMQLEQQAQQKQAEVLQPIMANVQKVIDELRTERGWALVLDAAEGGIISASAEYNVTQQVVSRLRQATAQGQGQGGSP